MTLTVSNGIREGTITNTVDVSSATGPTASFTVTPASPLEIVDNVFFNASGSTAASGRTIVSYAWSFSDGATGSGVTLTRTFSSGGDVEVTLTVTDDLGNVGIKSATVTVRFFTLPVASFIISPSSDVAVRHPVFVDASESSGTIVSYDWNFGDGTTGSGVRTSHEYEDPGTYVILLTVTDVFGSTDTETGSVTVTSTSGNTPTAVIVTSPDEPAAGATVFFNGETSTAPPGRFITRYEWDFGDGTDDNGSTVSHVYATAGDYTVVLTVTDSAGVSAMATATVEVQ